MRNPPKQDKFVVFCTPTYNFSGTLEFCGSVAQTVALLMQRNIPHAFMFRGGLCFVDVARNLCCDSFLRDFPDATDLFFLDDDVGFPGAKVIEFLDRPEDIVCGIYPKKSDSPEYPVTMKIDDAGKMIEKNGMHAAVNIPGGFLRIKRHVIEKMAAASERYDFYDKTDGIRNIANIFETGMQKNYAPVRAALETLANNPTPENCELAKQVLAQPICDGQYWGEDSVFSRKALEMGFDIWVDSNIEFTHRGQKKWSGNFSPVLQHYIDQPQE